MIFLLRRFIKNRNSNLCFNLSKYLLMKKIRLLMISGALLLVAPSMFAQEWTIGGDPNTDIPAAGGRLGTNGNRQVIFETNNAARGVLLNTSGFWGFGPNFTVTPPVAQVHIDANDAATNPFRIDVVGVARMIVNNNGLVGVNTLFPNARLHVNSAAGETGLRVQINGSTKLLVDAGGGVSVGSSLVAPANGLFVSGDAGIGTTAPAVKLHVTGGTDAAPGGGGFIVTGLTTGANVSLDDNEIMARSNGAVSDFFINNNGGDVVVNGAGSGGLVVGTSAPAAGFPHYNK
jgi:hypothetical protein